MMVVIFDSWWPKKNQKLTKISCVVGVKKCFILFASFRATKQIQTLINIMLSIITYSCISHTSCCWCRQIRSYCWYSICSPSYSEIVLSVMRYTFFARLSCEQALRGTLAAGQEKEGELLQLRHWNLNSTSNSPVAPHPLSCQISTNQHEAGM